MPMLEFQESANASPVTADEMKLAVKMASSETSLFGTDTIANSTAAMVILALIPISK